MKIVTSFVCFISAIFSLNAQCTIDANSAEFLSSAIHEKRKIFLATQIDTFAISEVAEALSNDTIVKQILKDNILISDTLTLSKTESEYIRNFLHSVSKFEWTKESSSQLKFFIVDIVKADTMYNWKHEGEYIYTIMPPIFLRNNSLCIFYYNYSCGGMCGYGSLSVFKKNNNNWTRWWELFHWYS